MEMVCARLNEVMAMKKSFIKQYGEQALIDDAKTAQSIKELHEKQVIEYKQKENRNVNKD